MPYVLEVDDIPLLCWWQCMLRNHVRESSYTCEGRLVRVGLHRYGSPWGICVDMLSPWGACIGMVSPRGTLVDRAVVYVRSRSPDDAEWEDLDPRAIEAAQWTDREINKVIEQVKLHGTQNDQGLWQVTFGKMFTETAQIFDALSGILKTSKKYKVLDFAGEQLCEPILLPSGTISQGCQAGCTAGVVHHHLTLGVTHAAFAVTVAGILASKSDVDGKLI
eukprot:m.142574 g.142574  ORF g.142574 m.142574 type:complete len:220 (+) comp17679_c0_seq9:164-823(+)